MDLPSVESILEVAFRISRRIRPAFLGSGWQHIAFQGYAILCLGAYSIYRIIRVSRPSVVVLSKIRLSIDALVFALSYLICHQLVVAFQPIHASWKQKAIFLPASFLAIMLAMGCVNVLSMVLINRFGKNPYLIDTRASNDDDIWRCDLGFVRRVMTYYYFGLYIPSMVYLLFDGGIQLALICVWSVGFLTLLLSIHGPTGPVLVGYLLALWFATRTY